MLNHIGYVLLRIYIDSPGPAAGGPAFKYLVSNPYSQSVQSLNKNVSMQYKFCLIA